MNVKSKTSFWQGMSEKQAKKIVKLQYIFMLGMLILGVSMYYNAHSVSIAIYLSYLGLTVLIDRSQQKWNSESKNEKTD